jgi:hypothetical protein
VARCRGPTRDTGSRRSHAGTSRSRPGRYRHRFAAAGFDDSQLTLAGGLPAGARGTARAGPARCSKASQPRSPQAECYEPSARASSSSKAWTRGARWQPPPGRGLIKRLGVPAPDATADQAVQQRLIDAGLFDVLSALCWGGHPYLPKAAFTPPARELLGEWNYSGALEKAQPLQAALNRGLAELDEKAPGDLTLEVELGKARVPSPDRLRELLSAALRIAQINAQANRPNDSTERV